MRTVTTKVYQYDELSEEAKEVARNWYLDGMDDVWHNERYASYKEAKKIYDSLREIDQEIKGARLYTWIRNNFDHIFLKRIWYYKDAISGKNSRSYYVSPNVTLRRLSRIKIENHIDNCVLTGICYDTDFLQPIIDFLKKPCKHTDNIVLAEELPDYNTIAERDFEDQCKEENIAENIRANEYEFTKEGKRFS